MQNREEDFRPEFNWLFGFRKRRSSYQVIHVAAITIFYYAWLAACVGDDILVGRKNIMQVYLGHNAECEQQQEREGSKSPYDSMLHQSQKM